MTERIALIEQFVDGLSPVAIFRVEPVSENGWLASSQNCTIELSFARYECLVEHIEIQAPGTSNTRLNFFLLCHLRNAYCGEKQAAMPQLDYCAWVLITYFEDVLLGDFSIAVKHDQIQKQFFDLTIHLMGLPEDHFIKKKFNACDISWMDDVKRLLAR